MVKTSIPVSNSKHLQHNNTESKIRIRISTTNWIWIQIWIWIPSNVLPLESKSEFRENRVEESQREEGW